MMQGHSQIFVMAAHPTETQQMIYIVTAVLTSFNPAKMMHLTLFKNDTSCQS